MYQKYLMVFLAIRRAPILIIMGIKCWHLQNIYFCRIESIVLLLRELSIKAVICPYSPPLLASPNPCRQPGEKEEPSWINAGTG